MGLGWQWWRTPFLCRALCLYYLKDYDGALEAARITITAMPHRWHSYQVAGLAGYLNGGGQNRAAVQMSGS